MAKLNSGTRIYGTANVDTSIGIGSSGVINATGFYTTGTINAASFTISTNAVINTTGVYHTGVINAASYSIGSIYIANTTQSTFNSNSVFNANVTIGSNGDLILSSNAGIYANGTFGTNNQVLSSNGTGVYWANVAASGGGSFSNGQSISVANLVVTGSFTANSSTGTAGQVLSSNGTGVYWAAGSSGGFSNGQSISVANLAITGSLTAANSVGTSGQALISTGTGVQWGALSPGYNYSSQFNGSSTFLTTPTSATFNLNAVDWTIECWFYCTATPPATATNLIQSYQGTNNWQPYVGIGLNANLTFQIVINAVVYTTTQTFTLNSWNHVALVRSGGVVKFYLNGVATSVSVTSDITSSNLNWFIGKVDNAQGGGGYVYYYSGYLSNVRIVKGTAVYTAAFTPPTSPLSAITNTSLLTCTSITPTSDSSINNHALTNTGPVTTTATLSPFTSTTVSIPTASLTAVRQQFTGDGSTTTFNVAGGYTPSAISVFVNGVLVRNGSDVTVTSGSFITFTGITPPNGSLIDVIGTVPTTYSSITPVSYSVSLNGSQSLSILTNTQFGYGTGDFTVEFWVNLNYPGSGNITLFSQLTSAPDVAPHIYYSPSGINFYNGTLRFTGSTLSNNIWYHIALVRLSGSTKLYINGVQSGSTYADSNNYGSTKPFVIGDYFSSYPTLNGAERPVAFFSNVRVVKGVGIYTSNFTVPSSPLAITQSASGAFIQAITGTQTSLLTCNGPTIIDGSTNAFTITNNGSAPVSTAIVPTFTNVTINNPSVPYYSVTSLVVGGGGGGGGYAGGGGGAGGFVAATSTLIVGSTYTVVVGGGGSAGVGNASTGVSGGLSLFNTSTALGGGGGGAKTVYALSGGSGGGGGPASATPTGPGSGTNGQGFAGGVGFDGTSQFSVGGGGGGAGAVGGNSGTSTANTSGGNGGAGLSSSITGSSVTYAGGGGGGTDAGSNTMAGSAGAGGSGGGGTGGKYTVSAATAGTTNLGGGGGGAGWTTAGWNTGGAGGSGVVILSVPTANYTGTTTGSPTVTTSGGFTIIKFTASGSYTA